jgi:hypothetical protein
MLYLDAVNYVINNTVSAVIDIEVCHLNFISLCSSVASSAWCSTEWTNKKQSVMPHQ